MIKKLLKSNRFSLLTIATVAVFLAIWEGAAYLLDKDYLLPRFSQVCVEVARLFTQRSFYINLGYTLARCLIGFACSFVLGVGLGVAGGLSPKFRQIMSPFTAFLKTTPVMALTLLLMVWFKAKVTPVIIGFIMVFPIIYQTVADSISSVDKKLLQVGAVYGFSHKEKLRFIYLPEILPMLFSVLATTFGLNIKAVISAEILTYAPRSLGVNMYVAKADIFDGTAILFAYVLIAVAISALFEISFTLLKRLICAKYE